MENKKFNILLIIIIVITVIQTLFINSYCNENLNPYIPLYSNPNAEPNFFSVYLKNLNSFNTKTTYFNFKGSKLPVNIHSLTIAYSLIDEEDKKIINNLENLKELNFIVSPVAFNASDNFDFSWVKEDININLKIVRYYDNDIEDLYMYSIYNKLDENTKDRVHLFDFNEERLIKLNRWNNYFISLVDSFEFNNDTTDEEKIFKITSYVIDKLEYDPDIKEKLENQYETILINEKVKKYNQNPLEILDSGEGYGICSNYAALTSTLGFYSNIKLDYTIGYYKESGHAWITYYKNDEELIIDPTALDNSKKFKSLNSLSNESLEVLFIRKENIAFSRYKKIE